MLVCFHVAQSSALLIIYAIALSSSQSSEKGAFGDKNHSSRRINFIFIFGLIRRGAFGALRLL